MKTKLVNKSCHKLIVRKAGLGIHISLGQLRPQGDELSVKFDPHTTYARYDVLFADGINSALVLNSDDLLEYGEIEIFDMNDRPEGPNENHGRVNDRPEGRTGQMYWKGSHRVGMAIGVVVGVATVVVVAGAVVSSVSRRLSRLKDRLKDRRRRSGNS